MGGADLVTREQPYQTAIHCQRSQFMYIRHRFSVAPPLTYHAEVTRIQWDLNIFRYERFGEYYGNTVGTQT